MGNYDDAGGIILFCIALVRVRLFTWIGSLFYRFGRISVSLEIVSCILVTLLAIVGICPGRAFLRLFGSMGISILLPGRWTSGRCNCEGRNIDSVCRKNLGRDGWWLILKRYHGRWYRWDRFRHHPWRTTQLLSFWGYWHFVQELTWIFIQFLPIWSGIRTVDRYLFCCFFLSRLDIFSPTCSTSFFADMRDLCLRMRLHRELWWMLYLFFLGNFECSGELELRKLASRLSWISCRQAMWHLHIKGRHSWSSVHIFSIWRYSKHWSDRFHLPNN